MELAASLVMGKLVRFIGSILNREYAFIDLSRGCFPS